MTNETISTSSCRVVVVVLIVQCSDRSGFGLFLFLCRQVSRALLVCEKPCRTSRRRLFDEECAVCREPDGSWWPDAPIRSLGAARSSPRNDTKVPLRGHRRVFRKSSCRTGYHGPFRHGGAGFCPRRAETEVSTTISAFLESPEPLGSTPRSSSRHISNS